MTATALTAGLFSAPSRAELQAVRLDPLSYKLSLSTHSIREFLLQNRSPAMISVDEFIGYASRWRFDALEASTVYFDAENPAGLRTLKAKSHRAGIDISSLAIQVDLNAPNTEMREAEVAHAKTWVDFAMLLGAPCIRVLPGGEHDGQGVDAARTLVVEASKAICDYANDRGIFVALENSEYLTASADDLLQLAEAIDHPWFGISLNTGNFKSNPYENIAKASRFAVGVRLTGDVPSADGQARESADFLRIFQILYDAGYKSYVTLDYASNESFRDLDSGMSRFINAVRDGMAAAAQTRPIVFRGEIHGLHEWSVRPALPDSGK